MVTIAGTGTFRPASPVVYINVEDCFDSCVDLHEKLQAGPLQRDLPFSYHPHVTIAHVVAPESLDEAETVLKNYRVMFPVVSMGLYEHDVDGIWQLREELDFGTESDNDAWRLGPADAAANSGGTRLFPLNAGKLLLAVIQKRMEWGKARRSGAGPLASVLAMFQWLLARFNAFRPMRAWQHYNLQHGSADERRHRLQHVLLHHRPADHRLFGCGAGPAGPPALLDTIISSVAPECAGLLKVSGGEGLVDPQDLLNPDRLGWGCSHRRGVTVFTLLRWISGIRDGLRGVMELPPLKVNPAC